MKTKYIIIGVAALTLLSVVTIRPVGVRAICTYDDSGNAINCADTPDALPAPATVPDATPAQQPLPSGCLSGDPSCDPNAVTNEQVQQQSAPTPDETPAAIPAAASSPTYSDCMKFNTDPSACAGLPGAPATTVSNPTTSSVSGASQTKVNSGSNVTSKTTSVVSPVTSSVTGLPLTTASTPSGTFTIQNPLSASNSTIGGIVQTAAQIFAYVVVLIGVLALIWTGLQYVLAQGNSEKLTKLKSQLLWIVVGIAIVIGARIIISVVINTLAASGVVNQNIINNAQDANK